MPPALKAQTPVLLAPDTSPVESTVLSEYSGNLGIGVASPTVKLDVDGAGKFTGTIEAQKLKLTDGVIDGTGTLYLSPTGSGSLKMIIGANANVAIGQSNTFGSGANNLIVGTSNVLSSAASHHFITGISNTVSGLLGFTHGYGNNINAGVLAGFNYAIGKENTINFNETIALDGFNYALGMSNEITSNSKYGGNFVFGGSNKITFTSSENSSGLNYILGLSNKINVNTSSADIDMGLNYINGVANSISGNSTLCFQSGLFLSSTNSNLSFTMGHGDVDNMQPLVNNHPSSLMVGFGIQPTFFVQDNHAGINTTSTEDAALRISSKDGYGTKLDIKAGGTNGWQNQIRFVDSMNNFRHLIVDNFEKNHLVIMPGYWNDGNPVANNILQVEGKMFIGNEQPNGSFADYKLGIDGMIVAKRYVVQVNSWADNVFEESYPLATLSEVENFVKENKHLPEIPSEKEVLANGVSLEEMNRLLLQKVEELTLHLIRHQKEIELLKSNNCK